MTMCVCLSVCLSSDGTGDTSELWESGIAAHIGMILIRPTCSCTGDRNVNVTLLVMCQQSIARDGGLSSRLSG